MKRTGVGFALLALSAFYVASCGWLYQRDPVQGVYCDGTPRWPCTDPAFPVCRLTDNRCVSANDVDMTGCGAACSSDMDMMQTVCSGAADCTDPAKPICDTTLNGGTCRPCAGSADDAQCAVHAAGSICLVDGTNAGKCGACRPANGMATTNNNCSSTMPVCATNGTCRICRAKSECPSGVCKTDGSCAAATDVAYVDNRGSVTTCKINHPSPVGTMADPLCDIQDAVAGSKQFSVVKGEGTMTVPAPYGALSITNRNIMIVGPGKTASPAVTISPTLTTSDAVLVSGTSVVQLTGVEITGAVGTHNGVSAGSGTTVTIKDANIHGNGGAGISATDCTLTVDASYIGPNNGGGGISLSGSTSYSVTNSIVAGNGTTARGVTINDTATGTFAFNTVASNSVSPASPGGVSCGLGAAKLIQSSVVVGNTSSGGTQFAGNCMLQNVVTGPDGFMGATMMMPTLDTTFRLKPNDAANQACCVDKIASPTTPNADHDVDFAKRPQGATGKWTIGGNELAQ